MTGAGDLYPGAYLYIGGDWVGSQMTLGQFYWAVPEGSAAEANIYHRQWCRMSLLLAAATREYERQRYQYSCAVADSWAQHRQFRVPEIAPVENSRLRELIPPPVILPGGELVVKKTDADELGQQNSNPPPLESDWPEGDEMVRFIETYERAMAEIYPFVVIAAPISLGLVAIYVTAPIPVLNVAGAVVGTWLVGTGVNLLVTYINYRFGVDIPSLNDLLPIDLFPNWPGD
jgi:hypothetical protein